MQLINVGFGNIVVASRIVAIVSPESKELYKMQKKIKVLLMQLMEEKQEQY